MKASAKKQKQGRSSLNLVDSLLSGAIVLYATYLIHNQSESKALLSGLLLLIAGENALRQTDSQQIKVLRLCVTGLYLAGAVLALVLEPFHSCLMAAAAVEFVVILFHRVAAILKKPKKRVILVNVICILLILAVGIVTFGSVFLINQTVEMDKAEMMENPSYSGIAESMEQIEELSTSIPFGAVDFILYVILMGVILLRMILHIVFISISQMKLKVLLNIIQETYVLEILLGLLLMIISCSTVLMTFEDSMSDYGDALWYCFALVTTIGFGDITASTIIGRILSVFLGIYGIVVVAIITSVIVNFYGEMRRITGEQKDENAEKELPDAEE